MSLNGIPFCGMDDFYDPRSLAGTPIPVVASIGRRSGMEVNWVIGVVNKQALIEDSFLKSRVVCALRKPASWDRYTVDLSGARFLSPLLGVVASSCKFRGIRGLDKTTRPLFPPPFFLSAEGLAAGEWCRLVSNSVQLGHSQLGGILTPRLEIWPSLPCRSLILPRTCRDLRQLAFLKSWREYRRNLVPFAYSADVPGRPFSRRRFSRVARSLYYSLRVHECIDATLQRCCLRPRICEPERRAQLCRHRS